jgi:dienelactone hydrolase
VKHPLASIVLASVLAASSVLAAEDLSVLKAGADGTPAAKQLELWLKSELYRETDRRASAFEKMIKTESGVRAWQAERRAYLLDKLGGLPERTPLNPQIVGTLQGKGYRVEKIIFESQPGLHVTANLYLPEAGGPWPAVIIPCGHSHDGKAFYMYQRLCALLARNGMAAMCYDPISQGERYQILDLAKQRTHFEDAKSHAQPHPNIRYLCTTEHTFIGLGSTLLGGNVAQFRVWDGMRVIDYLQSRPDIRGDKIGCAGSSGGGTLTSYLMALDDRIVAAAPGCFLTTYRRLIDLRGAQDGEQNIFGQLAVGFDEADYVTMRAPKPTLIFAGTRDATFDIRGTWEVFVDAKRVYSRLGRSESVEISTPDAPHGYSVQMREATARWMHRWLIGGDKLIREFDSLPDAITDTQLRDLDKPDWTQDQLTCTPKGQVLLNPGERTVFQINADTAAALKTKRAAAWRNASPDEQRRLVRTAIGAGTPAAGASPVQEVGRVERGGVSIRKLVLTSSIGVRVPALAFVPAKPTGVATLYLHGVSMAKDAAPGGPIDALVRQGQIVLAAELRGIGETETGHDKVNYGRGYFGWGDQEIFLAFLLGRNYVAMRVEDVAAWTRFLKDFSPAGGKPTELHVVATGEAAIPALHAAALQPGDFRTVALRGMIGSWEEVVRGTALQNQWVNTIHGVLRHYDLPDLIQLASAAKTKVTVGPELALDASPTTAAGVAALDRKN